MPFSIDLWQVQGTGLKPISRGPLNREERLEEWLVRDSSLLGVRLLLIGRQVTTVNNGRIDLLGIDDEANLVILELKRDKTPREIVAQALDYASWVADLSYEEVESITHHFLGKSLSQAFTDFYDSPLPQAVNTNHSIVILASELDESSERIVQYLGEKYRVPINVLFFTFFNTGTAEFVGRAWLKDPEEVQERTQPKNRAPWSGFYFVNVGEGVHRNWDDCRKYGFLSAGQGERYSNAMKRLEPGDLVFAYMKGLGYVGFGTVERSAIMVRDFQPDGVQQKLLQLPLKQPHIAENDDDPALSDWTVAIKWTKTFDRDEAKRFPGMFANQNIVCQLRDASTVDFLKREFDVTETQ